jgi:hypothetical protein
LRPLCCRPSPLCPSLMITLSISVALYSGVAPQALVIANETMKDETVSHPLELGSGLRYPWSCLLHPYGCYPCTEFYYAQPRRERIATPPSLLLGRHPCSLCVLGNLAETNPSTASSLTLNEMMHTSWDCLSPSRLNRIGSPRPPIVVSVTKKGVRLLVPPVTRPLGMHARTSMFPTKFPTQLSYS